MYSGRKHLESWFREFSDSVKWSSDDHSEKRYSGNRIRENGIWKFDFVKLVPRWSDHSVIIWKKDIRGNIRNEGIWKVRFVKLVIQWSDHLEKNIFRETDSGKNHLESWFREISYSVNWSFGKKIFGKGIGYCRQYYYKFRFSPTWLSITRIKWRQVRTTKDQCQLSDGAVGSKVQSAETKHRIESYSWISGPRWSSVCWCQDQHRSWRVEIEIAHRKIRSIENGNKEPMSRWGSYWCRIVKGSKKTRIKLRVHHSVQCREPVCGSQWPRTRLLSSRIGQSKNRELWHRRLDGLRTPRGLPLVNVTRVTLGYRSHQQYSSGRYYSTFLYYSNTTLLFSSSPLPHTPFYLIRLSLRVLQETSTRSFDASR